MGEYFYNSFKVFEGKQIDRQSQWQEQILNLRRATPSPSRTNPPQANNTRWLAKTRSTTTPLQPANRKRNSRQRRLSRPDLDASHPSYHEREGAEGVHKSDGKTGTA